MTPKIAFDKAKYLRLRQAYETAKLAGKSWFYCDGDAYLVAYARYLIEYLDQFFADKPKS